MDIQSRKISSVQELLKIQDEKTITDLENLLQKQKTKHFKNSQSPLLMEQLNYEIDETLEDSNNNKLTKGSDLKHNIKQ